MIPPNKTHAFSAVLIGLSAATSLIAGAATLSAGYTKGSGSELLIANGGSGAELFFDGAALGGDDVTGTNAGFFSILLDGSASWGIGDTVSISGFALPIIETASMDGTFTFDIREGAGGTGAAGTVGLDSLGTQTASFTTAAASNTPHYVNFDTPITFVADANSTSIVINWSSTASFRWKKESGPGPDRLPQINYSNGNFVGGDDAVRVSIAGAVIPVPEPSAALLGGIGLLALLRRRRD